MSKKENIFVVKEFHWDGDGWLTGESVSFHRTLTGALDHARGAFPNKRLAEVILMPGEKLPPHCADKGNFGYDENGYLLGFLAIQEEIVAE